MEEVTRCSYIDCIDTREKEQILHELPVCDTGLCVKWLINSGHVDLIGRDFDSLRSMKFFICNSHFTEDCYLSKGTLKENAVPSPHWSANARTGATSKPRQFQKQETSENIPPRLEVDQEKVRESIVPELSDRNDRPFRTTRSSARLTRSVLSGLAIETPQPVDAVDANHWCRTCATRKHDLISMTTNSKTSEMSLLSKLKLLIEIDDEDALPTKMCDECVLKLEQSFKFFQQIYIADNTLRQLFPKLGADMRNGENKKSEEQKKEKEKRTVEEKRPRGRGRGRGRGRPRKDASYRSVDSRPPPSPKPTWRRGAPRRSIVDKANVVENTVENREPSPTYDNSRGTVFSLLTDTCRTDEELDWADVLKLMNEDPSTKPGDELSIEPAIMPAPGLVEPVVESSAKAAAESEIQNKTEHVTDSAMDSTLDSMMDSTVESTAELATESTLKPLIEPDAILRNVAEEAHPESTMEDATETTPAKKASESRPQSSVKPDTEPPVESSFQPSIEPPAESPNNPADDPDAQIHCEFCDAVFRLRRQLRTHLLSNHPEETTYMCSECLACYHNESLLVRHRALRHSEHFSCEHCSHKFPQKVKLAEHVFKCHPPAKRYYCCDACGETFVSKRVLIEHVTCSCTLLKVRLQSVERSNIMEKPNGNLDNVDRPETQHECTGATGIANGVVSTNPNVEPTPQADGHSKTDNNVTSSALAPESTGRISESFEVEDRDDEIPDTSKRRRTSPP